MYESHEPPFHQFPNHFLASFLLVRGSWERLNPVTQDHNIAKNHLEEKTIEIQEVVILEAINLADH